MNEYETIESGSSSGSIQATEASLSDKLQWIETTLQSILTTYKATNNTSLSKVAVFDTNSMTKKYQDYLDSEQLVIIYRELPGLYPNMPIADKILSASFFVYALEKEKYIVKQLIDEFTDTYNMTLQELTDNTYKFQFTNLTPIGSADNKGALYFQTWQFGATITVIDSITSIFDRVINIESTALSASKGLVSARFEKIPVYAEYSESTSQKKMILKYMHYVLTFSILDSDDTSVAYVKGLVYDSVNSVSVTYTSGDESITFTGKIRTALDDISEQGYPILNFIIERG